MRRAYEMQPADATQLERRKFLKTLGYFITYSVMAPPSWLVKSVYASSSVPGAGAQVAAPISPVGRGDWASRDFNGDEIGKPHDLLWNIPGYLASKGGIPPVSESVNVAVIGGGISGLTSAYLLRDLNPLVLEQAHCFGGNSKGERMGDSAYSIGAAYITTPEPGSEIHEYLSSLGILSAGRRESSEETLIEMKGRLERDFWKGATDARSRAEFHKVYSELQKVLKETFPDIPHQPESALSVQELARLDSLSFDEWLQDRFGEVHPHIREYFQLYGWSSFGGSTDELSAAQMLNFLAAETESVTAFPGGNSAIADAAYRQLLVANGASSLRSGSMVLDVTVRDGDVLICYETPEGQLKSVSAKFCIVALPKFVAQRIVSNLSAEQQRAMSELTYRGYLVGNVFIRGNIPEAAFDIYRLKGEVPPSPRAMSPGDRRVTDFCFADWAGGSDSDFSVLTFFRPLPYDGARQFLFSPEAHSKHQAQIREEAIAILRGLSVDPERILGIRLTRWGHSIPLAEKGLIASGVLERARAPVGGRVFFANQDNWANPAFESAFEVAREAAAEVRRGSF
jgi:hypothetical protein